MRAHANDRKARKTKRDGGDTGVKEEVEEGASRRKRHTVTNDVLRMFLQAWRDGKTSFVLPVFHTNAAMMYWYANADEPVALADLADLGDQDQGAAYLLLLLPWRRDGDVDVVQVYQAYDVDGQTIVDTENHKLYVRRSDAPCFQPPGTQCVYVLPGHFTKVPRLPRLVVINRWTSKPAVGTALSDDGSVVVLQHGIISHNSHMQMLFQRLLGDRLRGHDRTPIRLRFVWHTSLWRRADQDSAILEPDLEPDAEPGIEEEEAILSASLFSEEGHAVLADAALRSSALRNLRLESPLTHSFSTLDLGVLQLLCDAANSKCGVEVAIAMHGTIELDVDVIKAPYGMCVEMLRFAIPGCVAYARYRNAIYRYNYHALHAQTGKYGMPDLVFADQLSIRSGGTTSAEDGKFDRATARQTRPGEHCGLVVCNVAHLAMLNFLGDSGHQGVESGSHAPELSGGAGESVMLDCLTLRCSEVPSHVGWEVAGDVVASIADSGGVSREGNASLALPETGAVEAVDVVDPELQHGCGSLWGVEERVPANGACPGAAEGSTEERG